MSCDERLSYVRMRYGLVPWQQIQRPSHLLFALKTICAAGIYLWLHHRELSKLVDPGINSEIHPL